MQIRLARPRRTPWALVIVSLIAWLAPARASAQTVGEGPAVAPAPPAQPRPVGPARRSPWRLTFRGGGALVDHPASGLSALPVTGLPASILSGVFTEVVPSWYFGTGTSILNTALQTFRKGQAPMVPLDTMLTTASVGRRNGGAFGLSISRQIGPRYRLTLSVDGSEVAPTFTAAGLAAIEASRASYITAWTALLTTPQTNVQSVTSTTTINNGGHLELMGTGALDITVWSTAKTSWFVTLGGGLETDRGQAANANLAGHSAFLVGPASIPYDQTDNVTIQTVRTRQEVGILGGGWTWDLTPHWGLTADVRLALSGSGVQTQLSANPGQTIQASASRQLILFFPSSPAIVFDNAGVAAAPSTLSGTPLSAFPTFQGTGLQIRTLVTVGLCWRF